MNKTAIATSPATPRTVGLRHLSGETTASVAMLIVTIANALALARMVLNDQVHE